MSCLILMILAVAFFMLVQSEYYSQIPGFIMDPKNKFYKHNNFLISQNKETFVMAAALCKQNGFKLAELPNARNQSNYMEFLMEREKSSSKYWIGGNRLSGPWIWGTRGPKFTLTYWAPGQPNNYGGNQKCVATMSNSMKWDDLNCDHTIHYICQR